MDIFRDEQDFLNFLKRLKLVLGLTRMTLGNPRSSMSRMQALPEGAFTILSQCLMPNHFHFLIRQNTELSISKLISKVCTSYSIYFNKKYGHVGGVFQDQYKAVMIDNDSYLLWLSAYIHQNPKVAGLVEDLKDYPWSSYLDYIGARQGTLCDRDFLIKMAQSPEEYKIFVDESYVKISEMKDLEDLLLD